MSVTCKIALIFGSILLLRLLYYQSRLWQIRRVRRVHCVYLIHEKIADYEELLRQTEPLKHMMAEASVSDGSISVVEPAGYGKLLTTTASAVANIGARREDVITTVNSIMLRIDGYYRNQRNRTLNPLYWIELVVFLPRELLMHVGISSGSFAVRVSDLAYWAIASWQIALWILGKDSLLAALRAMAGK